MAERNPRFLSRPIVIVDSDPRWPEQFRGEREAILKVAGKAIIELEHFGSTSVPGLSAKPIIDILAGVLDDDAVGSLAGDLEAVGYRDFGVQIPGRHLFAKGGRANETTHHLHFVRFGSAAWVEPLQVRDALRSNRTLAEKYARLKRQLAAAHGRDYRGYGRVRTVSSRLSCEPRAVSTLSRPKPTSAPEPMMRWPRRLAG